ncbi:TPA: hypothetical protein MBE86_001799 [Klebsiella pneumoniae]|uniref:hypothetical protein n=1 Tax=Klebsiella TaxID=570 RepID=UPI00227D32BC|nr:MULTISPECIES: hypothetical protein [Klebsiella]HCB2273189.1 hypothetical protein [Citrobacter koseri]MCY4740869.1 hypothetical protein [Klebsiella pneumoniae]MDQ9319944.1 hypothetical protein [Klebsiella aerogenes]HBT2921246.1 hypothetical protein [Klebsiella pneumoniae]HBT3406471.1 hypothetical protein [Klebsiella pneumoniae]
MIEYLIFCVVAFVVTFGMYFLREYLRSRGYGPQLDAVARWLEPRERRMNRYRLKAANGLLGAAQSMNRLPLYGSKHHVVMIEQLRMAIMSEQAFRERQQRRK